MLEAVSVREDADVLTFAQLKFEALKERGRTG